MVFATQNPIEQGHLSPPGSPADRFMLMIQIDYPTFDDEVEVVRQPHGNDVHMSQP